jgi:hypothetical protein
MSTSSFAPQQGPVALISVCAPGDPVELDKFLRNGEALNKLSALVASRYKGAYICPKAVRLILQEERNLPLQDANGSGDDEKKHSNRRRRVRRKKTKCRRRDIRSTFCA